MPQLSLHTPIGDLSVAEEAGAIVSLDWGWGRDQTETALLARAREQLFAYFDGSLTRFDLPLDPAGTPYRRRIWFALLDIPYGATRSYADLARQRRQPAVGRPGQRRPTRSRSSSPATACVATNGIGGYSGGQGLPPSAPAGVGSPRHTPTDIGGRLTRPCNGDRHDQGHPNPRHRRSRGDEMGGRAHPRTRSG